MTEITVSTVDVLLWLIGLWVVARFAWQKIIGPAIGWLFDKIDPVLDRSRLTVVGRADRRARENDR